MTLPTAKLHNDWQLPKDLEFPPQPDFDQDHPGWFCGCGKCDTCHGALADLQAALNKLPNPISVNDWYQMKGW